MYTEEDLLAIRAQQKKRWLILSIPAVLLIAGIVVSLVFRLEWLTSGLTVVLGCLIIAGYDLAIRPLHCYEVHLNSALHGRSRSFDGEFAAISPDLSLVDGVRYYAVTLNDVDAEGEPCDRMLYFDAQKTFPAIQPGTRLHVRYHDREIADLSVL